MSSWQRTTWLLALMVGLIAVITYAGSARAPAQAFDAQPEGIDLGQDGSSLPNITPYALFQFSTLNGSGNTMSATEVPVLTSTGAVIYKNVTAQFKVDSAGNLTLTPGFPKVVNAAPPAFNAFKAGKYVGPGTDGNGMFFIIVGGPTAGPGGTYWGATAATSADHCTYTMQRKLV
jgi:hypothetical protein